MGTRNCTKIAWVVAFVVCSAVVTAQTGLEPIPFTNCAALSQEELLYGPDGIPFGSHWSWRFAQGPWAWWAEADDPLPNWDMSAFAREEDLWGVGGSLSIIAHEPGEPSAIRGRLVLEIQALDHAMNFSAEDAIVDEEAGVIMITFGNQNLPGVASTIITGTLEKTGVFESIELVGDQNIHFNGHLFLRRIAGMDLQANIAHVLETEVPLGGFCTAVWDGHYLHVSEADANEPTLLAHWPLDEMEGYTAHDEAGGHNALAIGAPVWQPDEGQIGGALELDGEDDFLASDCVIDPADGSFSVFAWIKGGEPGQVIISQQGGANWLGASVGQGTLMTELNSDNGPDNPLDSEVAITDGEWHHVGFTWDGLTRTLYVDDVPVARDAQDTLKDSHAILTIGSGRNLGPGTFFSGLIDDVQIYDRAVAP